jgi:hypothetical protein
MMIETRGSIRQRLDERFDELYSDFGSMYQLAKHLGINQGSLWSARQGNREYTEHMVKAMGFVIRVSMMRLKSECEDSKA